MRVFSGCLLLILGFVLGVGAFLAYSFFTSPSTLPLLPASAVSGADVTITASEQFVNDQLRAGLGGGLLGTDLGINLHAPNRADVSATFPVTLLGQSLNVRPKAAMHFGVSNGAITIDLDRVDVAGFNVPQQIIAQQVSNLKRAAEEEINAEIKRALANTGLRVVAVEAEENSLLIKLSR